MQCMSQLSESTCPQLQHQGTKATNWSKGAMLGKKKKVLFSQENGSVGRPEAGFLFGAAQEDYCYCACPRRLLLHVRFIAESVTFG